MTHSSWVRSTGSTVFKSFMFSPIDCLVARGTSPNIPRNGQLNQFNQNSSEPPPPYPIIAANVTNLIQNRQSPTQSNTTSTTGSSSNYDGHTFTGHYDSHMNYCKFRSNTTKWPIHLTIAVYHFFINCVCYSGWLSKIAVIGNLFSRIGRITEPSTTFKFDITTSSYIKIN